MTFYIGSRDGTIRLWSIESKIISEMPLFPNKYINVHQPLLARSELAGKVRDLQFNLKTEVTLGVFFNFILSLL